MTTPQHTYSGVTPEQIALLVQAARAERAQAVRRILKRLFRRKREAQAWPAPNHAFTVHC